MMLNDMNIDPALSAEAVLSVAHALKPGGPLLMTVKFVTARRRQHERTVARLLGPAFDDIRLRRLPHNGYETTLCARRASAV